VGLHSWRGRERNRDERSARLHTHAHTSSTQKALLNFALMYRLCLTGNDGWATFLVIFRLLYFITLAIWSRRVIYHSHCMRPACLPYSCFVATCPASHGVLCARGSYFNCFWRRRSNSLEDFCVMLLRKRAQVLSWTFCFCKRRTQRVALENLHKQRLKTTGWLHLIFWWAALCGKFDILPVFIRCYLWYRESLTISESFIFSLWQNMGFLIIK
jgi:hypothetical protein